MKVEHLDAQCVRAGLDRPIGDAYGLPAIAYTDPEILAIEQQRLFESGWVSVASASQLPNPGDVRPVTAAGRPLLAVRDRDQQIRVFHNVCRHRGTKLVNEAAHLANRIISCPYHCWTYELDGGLRNAPFFDGTPTPAIPEQTRSELSLLPVRSAVWFDTVFVNLSGGTASFGDFIRPVTERWRAFDLSLLRLADASEFKVASNWKFIQENFLDAAHVPWVHSQLRGPKHVLGSEATLLSDDLFGYLLPGTGVGERAKQGPTLSGFPNLPAKFASALDLLLVFPNTGLLLTPRWAQVLSVHPVSPAETSELLSTYVVGEGMMREENAKSRHWLVSFLHEVNGQDLRIVRLQQDGRQGNASDGGRFSAYWDDLVYRFAKRIVRAYAG
jgi:choline monooxygenase